MRSSPRSRLCQAYSSYISRTGIRSSIFFTSPRPGTEVCGRIRKATDPELEEDKERKQLLEKYDCYYRYTMIPSYADMSDVLYFFAATYLPSRHKVVASGRYQNIFVNEVSADKIIDLR